MRQSSKGGALLEHSLQGVSVMSVRVAARHAGHSGHAGCCGCRRPSSWAGVSRASFPQYYWQYTELGARRKGGVVQAAAASSEASTTAPSPSQLDPASSEYDWKLGVALSGCSFEAYNDPEEQDGLMEVTPSGSRIVYTDK